MLASDFGKLEDEISMVNNSKADWFHIDVMDGVFVPNISFGTPIMNVFKKSAKKPLDVHLMIVNPDKYLEKFAELGSSVLTVHAEACTHLHRTVQKIKSLKMKAGVAINPHTPVSLLESIIGKRLDYIKIPVRESDQKVFVADIIKARDVLDWNPEVSPHEGISQERAEDFFLVFGIKYLEKWKVDKTSWKKITSTFI